MTARLVLTDRFIPIRPLVPPVHMALRLPLRWTMTMPFTDLAPCERCIQLLNTVPIVLFPVAETCTMSPLPTRSVPFIGSGNEHLPVWNTLKLIPKVRSRVKRFGAVTSIRRRLVVANLPPVGTKSSRDSTSTFEMVVSLTSSSNSSPITTSHLPRPTPQTQLPNSKIQKYLPPFSCLQKREKRTPLRKSILLERWHRPRYL